MVRYFYAWTPLVIVAGTIVFLTIQYLALAALCLALNKIAAPTPVAMVLTR